jgi:hypothetical protein
MTRFVFQGSGHTTGGGGAAAGVVVAVIAVAAFAEAGKGAARMAGEFAVVGVAAGLGLAAGALAVFAVMRLRGRRMTAPRQQVQLWHANPQAIPAPPRRAVEAPAQPVVNVNIDAGLLAGLLREAQRQQPPAIVQAETEELPR